MTTKELNQKFFNYILDIVISAEDVKIEYSKEIENTEAARLAFVVECFNQEYWHEYNRRRYVNPVRGFSEWLMGLPSVIHIDFYNYRILEIAVQFGSLPADFTEKQGEKIINNWFNLIANKFFQLCKRHKVNTDILF